MTTTLLTPPTVSPVTMAEARLALRIDVADLDTLISAWLAGIVAHAEHLMGRSIMQQSWRLTLDTFPDALRLYNTPVISVTTVKFVDEAGVLQLLSPLDYLLDNAGDAAYIVPAYGKVWPSTYAQINSVIVEYVAGYGATDAATPPAIRSYILAKLVEQFDATNSTSKTDVQATFLDSLLDRYRIWG